MEKNVLEDFLKNVEELQINALTVAKQVTADGSTQATVRLERKRAMPERMESPPRAHRFYEQDGFVNFVRANKTAGTLILADLSRSVIEAVLDDRAKEGFEVVRLQPALFPAFEMLTETLSQALPPRAFAQAMMLNRDILGATPQDGKQLALLWQQLTVSSKIEAAVGWGHKSVNGLMCTTQVKAGAGEHLVELPDQIEVNVPLFMGRPEQRFDLLITVVANSHGEVEIRADAPELEVLRYQEIRKMAENVYEALSSEVQVAMGCLATGEWKYNR